MKPISALMIIKNEAAYLERALTSLSWCDEIVVIDAMSTDASPEICLRPSAPWGPKIKLIQQEWLGFSSQRNFALQQAKHDWVFFLDGDEACSPELAEWLRSLLKMGSNLKPIQYKIRRQEYFLKKKINFGIWNPSYSVRFFPKAGVQFIGEVHEGVKSPYPTEVIHAPILHVEDLRIDRFMTKLNHYTSLQAKIDYDQGKRTHLLRILLTFPAMLYKNYIYYQAFRDGKEGFIISILEGVSRTVRHLKLWQIQRLKEEEKEEE